MEKETLERIRGGIKKAEEKLKTLENDIDQAKRAGIDVGTNEQLAIEKRREINRLKAVYGG